MATSLTNTPTSYEQAFSSSPTGGQVGRASTELVGFWGHVPVVQPAVITAVTTTAATSTTNAYGYTTAAQADAIVTAINDIITKLIATGYTAAS